MLQLSFPLNGVQYKYPHVSEQIIGIGDFNGHVGRTIDEFLGVDRGFSIGERNEEACC